MKDVDRLVLAWLSPNEHRCSQPSFDGLWSPFHQSNKYFLLSHTHKSVLSSRMAWAISVNRHTHIALMCYDQMLQSDVYSDDPLMSHVRQYGISYSFQRSIFELTSFQMWCYVYICRLEFNVLIDTQSKCDSILRENVYTKFTIANNYAFLLFLVNGCLEDNGISDTCTSDLCRFIVT